MEEGNTKKQRNKPIVTATNYSKGHEERIARGKEHGVDSGAGGQGELL